MPQVSVIVPIFNTQRYLRQCLTSIECQSLKDIEVICIDDCSADDGIAVAEEFARRDPRFAVIRHKQNLGAGGARNSGIATASSGFLAFVDSDDHVSPNMLQDMVSASEYGRYDVVICGFDKINEHGRVIAERQRNKGVLDPIDVSQNLCAISNPGCCNKLWRRSLYTDNEILFPVHMLYQDAATTPRLFSKARRVRMIGGNYYKYLIRQGSETHSHSDAHILDICRAVDILIAFFLNEGLLQAQERHCRHFLVSLFSAHARNVAASHRFSSELHMAQYLRSMLLVRDAYLDHEPHYRSLGVENLTNRLISPAAWRGEPLEPGGAKNLTGKA